MSLGRFHLFEQLRDALGRATFEAPHLGEELRSPHSLGFAEVLAHQVANFQQRNGNGKRLVRFAGSQQPAGERDPRPSVRATATRRPRVAGTGQSG